MNIIKLIEDIGETDPGVYNRPENRRAAFKNLAGFGRKMAAAAIPLGFGAATHNAYGQTSAQMADALNFALTLEYLQDEFYKEGLAVPGLIPASGRTVFTQIGKHETAHVKFLEDRIRAMGATPVNKPAFDFTGKGAYPTWNTDYQEYLTLAQAFEDTGVRAYKGQLPNLTGDKTHLTALLQIHSVEARHAAAVRKLRGEKPWIPEANGGGAPAAAYAGEDNVRQGTINDVGTLAGISGTAATEAFDEPLARNTAMAFLNMFIV